MAMPIRVLLADDHPLMRAGIRTSLNAEEDLLLVGEASDGNTAQSLCGELKPDVVLLDLNMPGPPAMQTVAYLHTYHPQIKVLMLTAYDDDAYVRGLISAGVAGYVLKDEAPEMVAHAVRVVMGGKTWFSQAIVEKLVRWQAAESTLKAEFALSERERDMLQMIAQGWDNAHIAETLHLAEQTVRNRISRIYAKAGVSSRPELMIWVREQGLDK